MQNLTAANAELFRRAPDECYESMSALSTRCNARKAASQDRWCPPKELFAVPVTTDRLVLSTSETDRFQMNDWSFSQLCRLAGVSKDTVNRLTSDTAAKVFKETLPRGGTKPMQLYTEGQSLRSIHGTSYTRVHDADLVAILQEYAVDFQPPQKAMTGATGLYCGEQDMFCFLIDPAGWTEIEGEAFAPGFFLWNSEVGRRSLGIQSFWFQAVCQNHIVWDAVEVAEFTRKHTANVHESLGEIRRIIEALVAKRDERRDGFTKVIAKAMTEKLGNDADEALKVLLKNGISRGTAKQALEIAERHGRFTIFSLVDALTRIAGEITLAGDRTEADAKASSLLALAI
jgi:hypothetical protein